MKNHITKALLLVAAIFIGGHEGYRAYTYQDPVGIPTVCFGHTATTKMGQHKTKAECHELLARDLAYAEQVLSTCAPVALKDHERVAFLSFIFNVGPGKKGVKDGFCVLKSGRPSTMRQLLLQGNVRAACNEFPKWLSAKGREFKGLVKRRYEEQQTCLGNMELPHAA